MKKILLTIILAGLTSGAAQPSTTTAPVTVGCLIATMNALFNAAVTTPIERFVKPISNRSPLFNAKASALLGTLASVQYQLTPNKYDTLGLTLFCALDTAGIFAPELRDLYKAIVKKEFKKHMSSGWSHRLIAAALLKASYSALKLGVLLCDDIDDD